MKQIAVSNNHRLILISSATPFSAESGRCSTLTTVSIKVTLTLHSTINRYVQSSEIASTFTNCKRLKSIREM